MTSDERLRAALSRLRAAVVSGRYADAQTMLHEVGEALRSAHNGAQLESLAHEALTTLAWARKAALAARAHDAARLARLRRTSHPYRSRSGRSHAGVYLTA